MGIIRATLKVSDSEGVAGVREALPEPPYRWHWGHRAHSLYFLADTRRSTLRIWGLRKEGTPKPRTWVCKGSQPLSNLFSFTVGLGCSGPDTSCVQALDQPGPPGQVHYTTALLGASSCPAPWPLPQALLSRGLPEGPAQHTRVQPRARGLPFCRPQGSRPPMGYSDLPPSVPQSVTRPPLLGAGRLQSLGTLAVRTVAKAG